MNNYLLTFTLLMMSFVSMDAQDSSCRLDSIVSHEGVYTKYAYDYYEAGRIRKM